MVFPADDRDVEVGILLDGVWVDAATVGGSIRSKSNSIRLRSGRSNWGGVVDAATLDFTMDNRDGRWSPRNESGAYYGDLRRNLPVRYGIRHGTTYLARGATVDAAPFASAAATAALDITGDIDWRIEFQFEEDLVDWINHSGRRYRLATKGEGGPNGGWATRIFRIEGGIDAHFVWWDGSVTQEYTVSGSGSYLSELCQQGRYALRFTLDVSTGEGIWYYSDDGTLSGTWVQIGDAQTSVGATSIGSTSDDLEVGGRSTDTVTKPFPGRIYAFELYDGIGGTLVADPVFEGVSAGASSFSDSSQTWTIEAGGRITNVRWRFHGELPSIPTRWSVDGVDVVAPVQAAGLLRRKRRRADVKSGPRRLIESDPYGTLVQYWPCEETAAANGKALNLFGATVGTAPINVSGGAPTPASERGFLGSLPLPVLDEDTWAATVDTYSGSEWTIRWHMFVPTGWTGTDVVVLEAVTSTHRFVVLMSDTGTGTLRVQIQNSGGTPLYTPLASAFEPIGTYRRYHLSIFDDSGDLGMNLLATTEDAGSTGGIVYTSTGVTASPGVVTAINVNPDADAGGYSLGHVSLYSANIAADSSMVDEISSFSGETAAARIRRLCLEEGLKSRIYGDPATSQTMGPQFPGTVGDLMQECADTDLGILHEAAECNAIAYRTRASMVAQGDTLADLTSLEFWYSSFDAQTTDQTYLPNRAVALAGSTVDSATFGSSTAAPTITLASRFTRIDGDRSNDLIAIPYTPSFTASTGAFTLVFAGYWTSNLTADLVRRLISFEGTSGQSIYIDSNLAATARPRVVVGGASNQYTLSPAGADLADGDRFVIVAVVDNGDIRAMFYDDSGATAFTADTDITSAGTISHTDGTVFVRASDQGFASDAGFLEALGIERVVGSAEAVVLAKQMWERNQIGVHALDYSAGEIAGSLEPEEDDADIANDWTVTNAQGGIAKAKLDDGSALSVSEPPVGAGRYPQSVTVSAPSAKLQQIADRLLELGTVDEPRISRLPLAFHHSPWSGEDERITRLLEARLGDLVTVDNNLAVWSTAQVAQVIQGSSQDTSNFEDYLDLLTTSAAPYRQVNLSTTAGAAALAIVGTPEWEYATSPPTVTNPDPVANGNTVLAVAWGQGTTNSPTTTVVPPSGVSPTLVMDETTTEMRLRAWTYANDGNNKTFGFNAGADNRCACILIPLDGVASSTVASAGVTTGNGPSLTAPAVATTVGDLAIVVAGRRDNSVTPGAMSGWTAGDSDCGDAVNPQGAFWYLTATGTTTTPPSVTWSGSSAQKMMHTIAFTRTS